MKLRFYKQRFGSTILVVPDKKLPHGFGVADPCYPCVWVSERDVEPDTILVSSNFWQDAVPADPTDVTFALEQCGGKERIIKLLEKQIREWEQYHKKPV